MTNLQVDNLLVAKADKEVKMKIFKCTAFMALAVTLFCNTPKKDAPSAAFISVKFIKGDVKVFNGQGISKANLGQKLFTTDRIFTAEKSSAELVVQDKGVIKLGEKSSLQISILVNEEGSLNANLKMNSGSVLTAVQKLKSNDKVNMQTPTAVAGVRGTAFVTEVGSSSAAIFPYGLRDVMIEKPDTSVSVLTGKVAVKDKYGSEVVLGELNKVVAGHETRLSKNSILPLEETALNDMKKLLVVEGKDAFSTAFMVRELKTAMAKEAGSEQKIEENQALKSRKEVRIKREASGLEENLKEDDLKLKSNKTWYKQYYQYY